MGRFIQPFIHSFIPSLILSFFPFHFFHFFRCFHFFHCVSLPSFQSFSFHFISFAPRSCTHCCFHGSFCHCISCRVKSLMVDPFTMLQLAHVSYKQPISYSHVPFSELLPRRVQGTTWYKLSKYGRLWRWVNPAKLVVIFPILYIDIVLTYLDIVDIWLVAFVFPTVLFP